MENREIKFRAWHHGGGDVRINGDMRYSSDLEIFFKNIKNETLSVELMQFTGLKDKNGVTYCQDDIVKVGERNYRLIKGAYMFELAGYWNGSQDTPSDFFSENQYLISEIIGNIHENQNLL